MQKTDDIMDLLGYTAEMDAAYFMLNEVCEVPECKESEGGFSDRHSPKVFVCIQSIIKCKRKLGKSVLKKDKELLQYAKERLQKYFVTVDRDEQIRIMKYVQSE